MSAIGAALPPVPGTTVAAGLIAAYVFGRQGLLQLRLEEREPSSTRSLAITASSSSSLLAASLLVIALR